MVAQRTFHKIFGLIASTSLLSALAGPLSTPTAVPVEVAFRPTVERMGQDIHIAFAIAPDCHLYRDRIRLEGPNKEPIAMTLPPGELHDDAVLGGTFEIYRGQVEWTVPVADDLASVKLIYQGCAEQAGICYAAQRRVFTLK